MSEEEFLSQLREICKGYTIPYKKYLQAVAEYCIKHNVYMLNEMEEFLFAHSIDTKEEQK